MNAVWAGTSGRIWLIMSVNMIQLGSREEWLKNRFNGIGGSEISAVVGCNPYLDNVTLWELKTGRRRAEDISEKPYVLYGTKSEEHLRALFALDFPQYKVEYIENNSFRNDKFPWAQASLDGWLTDKDGRLGVWECKTSNMVSASMRSKWKDGSIPQNYYCQILFYMAVIEADFAVLKAQLKTEIDGNISLVTRHYHIERADVEEDIKYLMSEGAKFWQMVQEGKEPGLILPGI